MLRYSEFQLWLGIGYSNWLAISLHNASHAPKTLARHEPTIFPLRSYHHATVTSAQAGRGFSRCTIGKLRHGLNTKVGRGFFRGLPKRSFAPGPNRRLRVNNKYLPMPKRATLC